MRRDWERDWELAQVPAQGWVNVEFRFALSYWLQRAKSLKEALRRQTKRLRTFQKWSDFQLRRAVKLKQALRRQTKRLLEARRRCRELTREMWEELMFHRTMEDSAADYIGVLENENAHLRIALGVLAERVQELEGSKVDVD